MKDKRKRAASIYSKLYLQRKTTKDIAQEMNPPVTASMVRAVIRGVKTSKRVKEAVADALGMKFEKVWGECDARD